jgi:membrane protein YqaA with SNARE-associated domain
VEDLSAYLGLAAVAFLAATILPGSSEALLTALLIRSPDDAVTLFIAATAGNTAGAALNWSLGRFLMRFADRRWFPVSPGWIERASAWFRRFGVWLLFFSWVPIIGDPLTVVAGLLRVRFALFLAIVALGKAARYAAVIGGVEATRSWFSAT